MAEVVPNWSRVRTDGLSWPRSKVHMWIPTRNWMTRARNYYTLVELLLQFSELKELNDERFLGSERTLFHCNSSNCLYSLRSSEYSLHKSRQWDDYLLFWAHWTGFWKGLQTPPPLDSIKLTRVVVAPFPIFVIQQMSE